MNYQQGANTHAFEHIDMDDNPTCPVQYYVMIYYGPSTSEGCVSYSAVGSMLLNVAP
jgi:hypothetical protein